MKIYRDLYFTTATILHWYPLLAEDDTKDIIIEAFRYCVDKQHAKILAFVIMDTHIHLVWHILEPNSLAKAQQSMLKYTAQRIRNIMLDKNDDVFLKLFTKKTWDRHIQIWKRKPLSIEIYTDKVLAQKVNYIHHNLRKKGMDDLTYKYSSASFYDTGIKNWDFL